MTQTANKGAKPIVLAYSGGLDTSFLVPWVAENTGRPVITVTVDTGGIDAAAAKTLHERALALGAIEHHQVDARADYFEQVVAGAGWNAFGYIAAEAELARMRSK